MVEKQQVLPLDGDISPKPLGKTPEQISAFEPVLRAIRTETSRILSAANEISDHPYESLKQVPIELLAQARLRALGKPAKSLQGTKKPHDVTSEVKASLQTYKPWSEERKFGNRGRKLNERVRGKYSIPDLFCTALQSAVLQNPEYYGICPLASEKLCIVKPDQRLRWLRAAEAKALEARLREHEGQ